MLNLILAVLSSSLISIIMRLSSDRVKGNTGMLMMNYLTCLIIAGGYVGFNRLFPADPALPATLGMGLFNGVLYLVSFVLFQSSVKRNGVVLSAIFMRLGLLVPLVLSIFLFREIPTLLQAAGFILAIGAIILMNLKKGEHNGSVTSGLIILLLASGCGDAMAKIYEELGSSALSDAFLFYTFVSAFVLCTGLTIFRKEKLGLNEVLFGCIIGIPNFFSAKFLLAALNDLPAVIVYPSYSVATILVITLAGILLFKEKLDKRQWVAMGGILAALAMLNI